MPSSNSPIPVNPALWTPTSTPLSVARAALEAAGQKPTKANLAVATKAALEAVRALTPEQLASLGEVAPHGDGVRVLTQVGGLIIDSDVEFFPPDWFD